ncbi:MAG TPA: glycosyltransferase family 39 protein [Gemmatimonadaceae bacterium]|jgi:4-amino-4-deoxy-L-arabinose transferase-like glycosyltransferase
MRIPRLAASLILGTLAFAGALVITSGAGPGLDPDSMSYMQAANTLAHGGALRDVQRDWASVDSTMPLAHWPPGYSTAIAGIELLGVDARQGARLIDALAAFVTLAVIVWLTGGSVGTSAGVIAGLLVMVTPAVVQVHESVLSEPLFIALLVLTLTAMTRARARPLLSGTIAGLASIVRYAGISLVGGVVLWQLARAGSLRERIVRGATAVAPAVVLQGLWVLRTVHRAGPSAIRQISLYGEITSTLREGWRTTSEWLVPGMAEIWGIFVAAGVAVLIVVAIWHSRPARERQAPAMAAVLLAACYLGLVLASRLFADPGIPLDSRLMAPLLVLLEVSMVLIVAPAWHGWPRTARALVAVVATVWWGAALRVSITSARYAMQTGNDFAEDCWHDSPLSAWVRENGAGHALYTNVPEALYFQAGRLSHELPDEHDSKTLRAFADTLVRRNALVIAFDETCGAVTKLDSVLVRLPLREVTTVPTGRVLAPGEPPAADTFRAQRP